MKISLNMLAALLAIVSLAPAILVWEAVKRTTAPSEAAVVRIHP